MLLVLCLWADAHENLCDYQKAARLIDYAGIYWKSELGSHF